MAVRALPLTEMCIPFQLTLVNTIPLLEAILTSQLAMYIKIKSISYKASIILTISFAEIAFGTYVTVDYSNRITIAPSNQLYCVARFESILRKRREREGDILIRNFILYLQ